jgi:hypothetical protein
MDVKNPSIQFKYRLERLTRQRQISYYWKEVTPKHKYRTDEVKQINPNCLSDIGDVDASIKKHDIQ